MERRLDFSTRLTHRLPGLGDHIRSLAHLVRPHRPSIRAAARQVPREEPAALSPLRPDEVAVTWIGHSTCVIRMGGLTLLTDPVLSERVHGVRRITPPGLDLDQIGPIDGVLISHDHYDHLDWPTLAQLPRDTPIFAGVGLARDFRKRGFTRVHVLDWWEDEALGPLRISFVPAHHWSGRGILDVNTTLWGGWVVTDANGRKVYFAGDTAYGGFFRAIGREHPNIDIAILPVGAYAPRWYNANTHVTPEEAVQALRDLGARAMVPIHWGTFLLSTEPVLEPLERTREAWDAAGRPRRHLWDLGLGETAVLRERPAKRFGRRKMRRPALELALARRLVARTT